MRTLTSRSRAVLAAVGTVAFGVATLGFGAPAYADEGDAPWCYVSTGAIAVTHAGSVVSSVPSGTDLTVFWTVNTFCEDYALFMAGPGFSGFEQVDGNQRSVRATPPDGSQSMTWTLDLVALDEDPPVVLELASRTVTVT